MSFMERQITRKQNWLSVETTYGTEYVDSASLALFVRDSDPLTHPLTDLERDIYRDKIRQYTEGCPQSWENIKGYGCRLSAPGYLDCTEWDVFDTKAEAEAYLEEMYPEDEETEPSRW
jgi:hypothetical protein